MSERNSGDVERPARRERSALFEHADDPIVEVEFVDGDPCVRAVNDAFAGTFGVEPDGAIGRNLNDLVAPDDLAGLETVAEIDERVMAGESVEAEVRRATPNGLRDFLLRSHVLADDDRTRAYLIYTDITERKRHERALDALHEASRELMRSDSTTDIARITVGAARDALGFPINGVALRETSDRDGSDVLRLAASTDTADAYAEAPESITPGDSIAWEVFESGESRLFGAGEPIPDSVDRDGLTASLYLPLGDHGILTLATTDERIDEDDERLADILAANAEAALDRAERNSVLRDREAELERQNERLEAFASVVSHDLRNPLSVAEGYTDLIRADCDCDGVNGHFDRIERAHDRMKRLIDDLLTLAREGESVGETQPVQLGDLAERCWDSVDTAGAAVAVECDGAVLADPERLASLFENLFRNAVEHGGEDVDVTVGLVDDGSGFYVADDGPGVPEEERETVFDRGYTTTTDGTGFGLSIVREIAEAHGWSVSAAESATGGARFEVRDVERPARDEG